MPHGKYRLYCNVFGCLNSTLTHPDITFFKLPGNSERRLKWLQLICRIDLKNKPNFTAYRVCETHFTVEDIWQSSNRKLLKKNTLPSLMLPILPCTIPGFSANEEKQTQTDLLIGFESYTQTENVIKESYTQTSKSLAIITTKLKAELLQCREKIKLLETESLTQVGR